MGFLLAQIVGRWPKLEVKLRRWANLMRRFGDRRSLIAAARGTSYKHAYETTKPARDPTQPCRAVSRLGRSSPVAGIFRHLLETDLLSRPTIRSHRYRSTGSRAGNGDHCC